MKRKPKTTDITKRIKRAYRKSIKDGQEQVTLEIMRICLGNPKTTVKNFFRGY